MKSEVKNKMTIDSKPLTDSSRAPQSKKELCMNNRWTISLCVDDKRFNQNFKSELQERYTLSEAKDNKINGEEVDLYIIDISLFEKNKEHLIELKRAHGTEIYPVMVLINEDTDLNEYPDVWDIADEIVSYPANIQFIYSRIELLLRYRKTCRSLTKSKLELDSTQRVLKKEKEFFYYAADNMPGIFFMLNKDLTFEYWNKKFVEYLGYADDEISELYATDIFETSDHDLLNQKINEVSEKRRAEFTTKLISKSGEKRDYFISGTSIIRDSKEMIIGSGIDVTEQLNTHFESHQQKQLMDAIINQSNSIIYVKDEKGELKLVNQAFQKIFGLSKPEALGENDYGLLDPQSALQIRKNDRMVLDEDGPIQFEEEIILNGNSRFYQTVKYPLKNVPGFENHICGISTDITIRKNLIKDLESINNRKNCLIEISELTDQYCTTNQILTNCVKVISKGFRNSESCHAKIILGENVFYSNNFRESDNFVESKAKNIEGHLLQITVYQTSGNLISDEERELLDSISHLLNQTLGNIAYLSKLQESEQRWQKLVQNDPDLVMIVKEGVIQFINKAGAEMYGTTPEKLIGGKLFDVIKLEELSLAVERVKIVEQGKSVKPRIYRIEHPDTKDVKHLRIQSIPISINGINGLQVVGTDLTNLVNSERELKKSLEEKNVLLQEIHHRVKNNLAVVSGLLELKVMSTDNEEVKNILTGSVLRIKSMALVHEKIYQQQSLSHVNFKEYLHDMVGNILESMDFTEQVKVTLNIDNLRVNVNQAVPCALIINEIVTNSVKHAFKNKEDATIEISLHQESEQIFIKVCDNGNGFPKDFLNKSTSMGSTIIKTLSEQLGANLYSDNRNGARISFDFRSKNVNGSSANLVTDN
tara:strand:- start:2938 stop:5565 length:2628 start_codon:yes stop_codon:yes gene_type:complete